MSFDRHVCHRNTRFQPAPCLAVVSERDKHKEEEGEKGREEERGRERERERRERETEREGGGEREMLECGAIHVVTIKMVQLIHNIIFIPALFWQEPHLGVSRNLS